MSPNNLSIANLGQIRDADVSFGDLTVLVGPQATGKSIFLQLLKLAIDAGQIVSEFRRFGIDWRGNASDFLQLYFGEGMADIWDQDATTLAIDGREKPLKSLTSATGRKTTERMFFIPAQRVMSVRDGLTRPFTDYRAGDPFVLREFSAKLHDLIQTEFGSTSGLFPQNNRLKAALRKKIEEHIFGGFSLLAESKELQRRISLMHPTTGANLPYLVWSAGQREFVPLLLGFYWLMPPAKVSRRKDLDWVVIEELEMGLHPNAISVVMILVLELLQRGYRVCLSTHSPQVLDVVWALRLLQANNGQKKDVLRMFELRNDGTTNRIAEAALQKESKVYFFDRDGVVRDISELNPDAPAEEEAGWGGLSGFSGHVGDVVADVVGRSR